ncbi:hypothetical protein C8J56DRAFT_1169615 [Mycena floridula]|nr:hypothetical protein C8J56DRAFT_1169615 [Mycena floridula]
MEISSSCARCSESAALFRPNDADQSQWRQIKDFYRSPAQNFAPRSLLASLEEDLRRCREENKRQKAYMNQLERHEEMLMEKLNALKALDAPVRRVPPEIWGLIFSFAVSCEPTHLSLAWIVTPTVHLSHVCSHWRSLVLSDQSLWSNIAIVFGEEPSPEEEGKVHTHEHMDTAVQVYLERSGAHPLNVSIEHCAMDPNLDHSLHLILEQSHRWRSLTLSVESWDPFSEVVDFYLKPAKGKLPLLEHLRLGSDHQDLELEGDPAIDFELFRSMSSLRSLSLDTETCSEEMGFSWEQIREFEMFDPGASLVTLSSCSQLIKAVITSHHVEPPLAINHPTILVPSLKELVIRGRELETGVQYLSLLSVPALTALTFTEFHAAIPMIPKQTFPYYHFNAFLSQSKCTITTLALNNMAMKFIDWLILLCALPSVQNLSLAFPLGWDRKDQTYMDSTEPLICDRFFQRLCGNSPALPNLERLSLSVSYTSLYTSPEIFIDAIESRWETNSECQSGTARLKYLTVHAPRFHFEDEVIEELESLGAAGMTLAIQDGTGFVVG